MKKLYPAHNRKAEAPPAVLTCTKCGLTKLLHHFSKDKGRIYTWGVSFYCKECDKLRARTRRKNRRTTPVRIRSDF